MQEGTIIIADNMITAKDKVSTFKSYLDEHPNFENMTLEMEAGIELIRVNQV